jgi:RNA polymerase sigma-70 factor (ECF subfamily)
VKEGKMKDIIERLFVDDYDNFKKYLLGRFSSLNTFDVEDIISKTFVRILSTGSNYGIENINSYFYSALKNGALDHIKGRKDEIEHQDYMELDYNTPEKKLLNEELKLMLKNAIDRLDPKSRYVFVSTEIYGKSFKELSFETGEKIGSLLSRKSRAMKKLREYLIVYMEEK